MLRPLCRIRAGLYAVRCESTGLGQPRFDRGDGAVISEVVPSAFECAIGGQRAAKGIRIAASGERVARGRRIERGGERATIVGIRAGIARRNASVARFTV